jgi:hypothetical protein
MLDLRERVEDVIKNAKDRLTNPFFFSFIISWVIWNWEVTIALIWYDIQQIKAAGYSNIFDFIRCQTYSFWLPVICAIGYTVLAPFFRNGLSVLHAWVNSKGNDYVFKFTKQSTVPVEMYMKLTESYEGKEGQVSKLIGTAIERDKLHTATEKQIAELQQEKIDLQTSLQHQKELNEQKERHIKKTSEDYIFNRERIVEDYLQRINDFTNIEPITGYWILKYKKKSSELGASIHISKGQSPKTNYGIIVYNYLTSKQTFNIILYHYDKETKKVFFACKSEAGFNRKIYELEMMSNGNLTGYENDDEILFQAQ